MEPNVNPLLLPESRQETEVTKNLTLRFIDLQGVSHELKVRAFAGCEEGSEGLAEAWDWATNTRDDMEGMGLDFVFDLNHERAASGLTLEQDDITPYAAVVLVAVRGQVLLCRFTSDVSYDGMLPGGKLEPGETPLQAVIREFEEECGAKLVSVGHEPVVVVQTHDGRPMCVYSGVVSEKDFPLDDWRCCRGEGYVRWVEAADVLDYYRPQLRDAAKKIFSSPAVRQLIEQSKKF